MADIIQKAAAEVENKNESKPKSNVDYLRAWENQGKLERAIPKGTITAQQFVEAATTAIYDNPELNNCDPKSWRTAAFHCAECGLLPNTKEGLAYLIPYNNRKKGVMEVQFQLGYKGLVKQAYRGGSIIRIDAGKICENDDYEYSEGFETVFKLKRPFGDRGKTIAYYALYETKDGARGIEFMTLEEIEAHAKKYSQSFGQGKGSPWTTAFDSMACKTVVKKLLKLAPIDSALIREDEPDPVPEVATVEAEEPIYSVDEDGVIVDE